MKGELKYIIEGEVNTEINKKYYTEISKILIKDKRKMKNLTEESEKSKKMKKSW